MKDRELLKLFLKNGWYEVRITESHHILEKDGQTVSIPVHGKDMKKGLEAALLKKAEL
jgi:Predicted periplasmic or secreted lipoprotein